MAPGLLVVRGPGEMEDWIPIVVPISIIGLGLGDADRCISLVYSDQHKASNIDPKG